MGLEHKKNVGTYPGGQESHQKEKGDTKDRGAGGSFARGAVLKGLPDQKTDYPKAGKDIAPSFQMLRDQDVAEGSI